MKTFQVLAKYEVEADNRQELEKEVEGNPQVILQGSKSTLVSAKVTAEEHKLSPFRIVGLTLLFLALIQMIVILAVFFLGGHKTTQRPAGESKGTIVAPNRAYSLCYDESQYDDAVLPVYPDEVDLNTKDGYFTAKVFETQIENGDRGDYITKRKQYYRTIEPMGTITENAGPNLYILHVAGFKENYVEKGLYSGKHTSVLALKYESRMAEKYMPVAERMTGCFVVPK